MYSLLLLPFIALSADLRWVGVDVSLWQDGRADFVYKIKWQILSGDMSGFYFQELSVDPYFNYENSYALDDQGRKYPLEIKDLGNKYDIILAKGRRYGPGTLTYIVHFGGDLGRSGNLARTTSEFGELVVLNWAPTQWDEAIEHYTVYVYYPITVIGKDVNPDDYGFRTEKFMNERYLLGYFGQEYKGEWYFTVRIHKNNVQANEKIQIQQYVPAEYFNAEKFGMIEIK